jgi:hypothetical protein
MKKNQRKSKQSGNNKPKLLPFIYSPVYNGYKPGISLPRPVKIPEQNVLPNNRQILIEFTPDNYIDSMNSEVNILITPVLPKN